MSIQINNRVAKKIREITTLQFKIKVQETLRDKARMIKPTYIDKDLIQWREIQLPELYRELGILMYEQLRFQVSDEH